MVRRQAADLAPGCLYWILDKCHLGSGPDQAATAGRRLACPGSILITSNLHVHNLEQKILKNEIIKMFTPDDSVV